MSEKAVSVPHWVLNKRGACVQATIPFSMIGQTLMACLPSWYVFLVWS